MIFSDRRYFRGRSRIFSSTGETEAFNSKEKKTNTKTTNIRKTIKTHRKDSENQKKKKKKHPKFKKEEEKRQNPIERYQDGSVSRNAKSARRDDINVRLTNCTGDLIAVRGEFHMFVHVTGKVKRRRCCGGGGGANFFPQRETCRSRTCEGNEVAPDFIGATTEMRSASHIPKCSTRCVNHTARYFHG